MVRPRLSLVSLLILFWSEPSNVPVISRSLTVSSFKRSNAWLLFLTVPPPSFHTYSNTIQPVTMLAKPLATLPPHVMNLSLVLPVRSSSLPPFPLLQYLLPDSTPTLQHMQMPHVDLLAFFPFLSSTSNRCLPIVRLWSDPTANGLRSLDGFPDFSSQSRAQVSFFSSF